MKKHLTKKNSMKLLLLGFGAVSFMVGRLFGLLEECGYAIQSFDEARDGLIKRLEEENNTTQEGKDHD